MYPVLSILFLTYTHCFFPILMWCYWKSLKKNVFFFLHLENQKSLEAQDKYPS